MKRPFRVAYATAESKTNYFVSIDNCCFGEASGSVYYGPNEEEIRNDLEKGRQFLETKNILSVDDLYEINNQDINPVSKSALIGAVLHWLSKADHVYPWQILKLDEPEQIRTSYTVSIDNPENMYNEILHCPYPIIKIKMGFEGDESLIEKLRKISGKRLRLDANGGWSPDKAEEMIFCAGNLGVDIIEQPTGIEHIRDWKHLKGQSKVNLFLDEGLNTIEDYHKYCGYIDGINIKMPKSGGIIEAKKIAQQAGKDKIKVMLGCMVESSVGISQSVYLSSMADFFDLDGPLLLRKDIATGINFELDKITVDEDIIGGPKIEREYLDDKTH